jgi:predicted transcriptional regulator
MARGGTAKKRRKTAPSARDDFDGLTEEQHAEIMRRIADRKSVGVGVPLDEILAWMKSWGTPNELPPPKARRLFHPK